MVRIIDFKFNSAGFETKFKTIIRFTWSTLSLTNNCRSNCQLEVELPVGGPTNNWQSTGSSTANRILLIPALISWFSNVPNLEISNTHKTSNMKNF